MVRFAKNATRLLSWNCTLILSSSQSLIRIKAFREPESSPYTPRANCQVESVSTILKNAKRIHRARKFQRKQILSTSIIKMYLNRKALVSETERLWYPKCPNQNAALLLSLPKDVSKMQHFCVPSKGHFQNAALLQYHPGTFPNPNPFQTIYTKRHPQKVLFPSEFSCPSNQSKTFVFRDLFPE